MNKKLLILFLLMSTFHGYLRAADEGKNYKYIPPIEVKTANQLLNTLINTNWDAKQLEKIIGKPDSYFLGYYLYFLKGISIRKTNDKYSKDLFNQNLPDGRVFNIVFNERYLNDILKRINLSSNKNAIIEKLGKPQFEDIENQVYGYKTKYFYIFFVGNEKLSEISIYKIDINYAKSVIKKLLTKVKEEEGYNFFEFELQRLQKQKKFEDRAKKGKGLLAPDGKRRAMMNDHAGGWDAGLIIYYVNRDGPDKEIIFGFYGAKEWLNDRYLILQESVTGMLHIYDILKNNNTNLDDHVGWQRLISVKDGQIIYEVDDFNVKKNYSKSYTFDQDGKIIIK